jgi:hypothetical protein
MNINFHPFSKKLVLASALIVALCFQLSGCGQSSASSSPAAEQPGMKVQIANDTDDQIRQAIINISTFPTELDLRIWRTPAQANSPMLTAVRDKTIVIVEDLFDNQLNKRGALPGVTLGSIELFGSNASYEYDNAADFGVHVFVNNTGSKFTQSELDNILKNFNSYVELYQEGKITFNGVLVEITFHSEPRTDSYKQNTGKGQYMIKNYVDQSRGDYWIEVPTVQPTLFNRDDMFTKAKDFIAEYNGLARTYATNKIGFNCSLFGDLDNKMGDYRQEGFTRAPGGLGNRSTENLTYRMLRRISVNIPDGVDLLEEDCKFVNQSLY